MRVIWCWLNSRGIFKIWYGIEDWLTNSILIEKDMSSNDVRNRREMRETAPQLSKGPALNSQSFFPSPLLIQTWTYLLFLKCFHQLLNARTRNAKHLPPQDTFVRVQLTSFSVHQEANIGQRCHSGLCLQPQWTNGELPREEGATPHDFLLCLSSP